MSQPRIGVTYGILAAVLFGATTPLAKDLLGPASPLLLAGLLYCGSGMGLGALLGARTLFGSIRTHSL